MKEHLWKKGQSGNPAGCPKGAHHTGRPQSVLRERALEASPAILERWIHIENGEDTEQIVNGEGETISVPAPVRDQLKAGELVLKLSGALIEEQLNQDQSVKNVNGAITLLKLMEEAVINANTRTGAGGAEEA